MKILLVVDIDNTVAENAQREHLLPNWDAFFHACDTDTPIVEIIDALKPLFERDDVDIIFVTGRTGYNEVKSKTQTWLDNHFPQRPVFYRPIKNFTKAAVYKTQVVDQFRTDEHTHVVVVDDDDNICSHFTNNGHHAVRIEKDKYAENAQAIALFFAPSKDISTAKDKKSGL